MTRGENQSGGSGVNTNHTLKASVRSARSQEEVRSKMSVLTQPCHESSVGHLSILMKADSAEAWNQAQTDQNCCWEQHYGSRWQDSYEEFPDFVWRLNTSRKKCIETILSLEIQIFLNQITDYFKIIECIHMQTLFLDRSETAGQTSEIASCCSYILPVSRKVSVWHSYTQIDNLLNEHILQYCHYCSAESN